MRTTLNLDDDVLETTRAMARAERRGLGTVISDLVRRGLSPAVARIDDSEEFPTFQVAPGTAAITGEMVKAALEDA